ncbi:MAG: ACT domain-containing protein [Clostridiales bacterium]|nr:ACT domain-containing protein [Clostridiales bacterium]
MRAIVTVVGQDRVGIIADVCALLAKNQVNVLDISQTVMQDYFTMIMMVDAEQTELPFARLVQYLQEEGRGLGLTIHVQREDIFNAMHRI